MLDVAGPALGHQLLRSEGWPHLQDRLTALNQGGDDVRQRLRSAIGERELDSAKDKSLALTWRLKSPAADRHDGKEGANAARKRVPPLGSNPAAPRRPRPTNGGGHRSRRTNGSRGPDATTVGMLRSGSA